MHALVNRLLFNSAVDILQTLVIWGVINLLEGYGNHNTSANGQGA
ncbi:hypothetical protein HYG84_08670 [Alkaliphilus sp. B6464]|nr:hypothetical protein HYG84_08670 [Alkaliphilus sp. B6464]